MTTAKADDREVRMVLRIWHFILEALQTTGAAHCVGGGHDRVSPFEPRRPGRRR